MSSKISRARVVSLELRKVVLKFVSCSGIVAVQSFAPRKFSTDSYIARIFSQGLLQEIDGSSVVFDFLEDETETNQSWRELGFALENVFEQSLSFSMVPWSLVVHKGSAESTVQSVFGVLEAHAKLY